MSQFILCRAVFCCSVVLGLFVHGHAIAQSPSNSSCRNGIEAAERKDKDGPLAIYQQADGKTLIEIKTEDLEKEFIFANYIDRGVAPYVGEYNPPKLIAFRLNGKNIDILRKDSIDYFNKEEALSRTQALTTSDTVIGSLKLHKCQPADSHFAYIDQKALTNLSSDFLSSFPGRGRQISAEMKGWQAFSDNISFISEHRVPGPPGVRGSFRANVSIRVRHILLERPAEGFKPRRADSRIGYFSVSRRNLGVLDQSAVDTHIRKWRLEKSEPEKEFSRPKKPIVFWIENTTPEKFRPFIKKGVLAWNDAFRAAGFIDAVEVYEQPEDADWEAGDLSKNVIRWQSARHARNNFGMAPAIHDPLTGEILGSDILLNYAGIGGYVDDWVRLAAGDASLARPDANEPGSAEREAQLGAPYASKIENSFSESGKTPAGNLEGSFVLASLIEHQLEIGKHREPGDAEEKITSSLNSVSALTPRAQNAAAEKTQQGATPSNTEPSAFAERMIEEVITQLTMHEVGHALGLTHNFRGSRWRSMEEIYRRDRTKGMISASVMDYLPINFSPIGAEQGDFANTRLGPYDIWAIEFGYRPNLNAAQRTTLLSQSKKPEHAFSEHLFAFDPHTLANDLTSAPTDYAKSSINFASEAMALAPAKGAIADQSQYDSLFDELSRQVYYAVATISGQVLPIVPGVAEIGDNGLGTVQTLNIQSAAKQKHAIATLRGLVFSPDALLVFEDFSFQYGQDFRSVEAMRMGTKRSVLSVLMNRHSLLHRYHAAKYGSEYGATELLFDLKQAVFGSDLGPFAKPAKSRRDQQIMFTQYLAGLISNQSDQAPGRPRSFDVDGAIVSAAARPVRDALLRELLTPTPWAESEVRAHRQELRAILW